MITILIADDRQLVREGVRRILEDEKDFCVVGEAADGREALEKTYRLRPDVLLMDVGMPDPDGVEVTRRLARSNGGAVRVLILNKSADGHCAKRLLRMGAMGYVATDVAPSELIEAIRTVYEGRRFVSASVREALTLAFIEGPERGPLESLTDREFQVLRRLALGATNREIAEELSLSVKTVDGYRLRLLGKLQLRNNVELSRFATQQGIVKQ